MGYSIETICQQAEIIPETLIRWRSEKLICNYCDDHFSAEELIQIKVVRALTTSGDSLDEIATLLKTPSEYRYSGWKKRFSEFQFEIVSGNNSTLIKYFKYIFSAYSYRDVNSYFLPMVRQWVNKIDFLNKNKKYSKEVIGFITILMNDGEYYENIKFLLSYLGLSSQELVINS